MSEQILYPFCAIVGQERMKRALILNIINPALGGVLIRGEKGTAKSTAVRALAEVLGQRREVKGCRFGCSARVGKLAYFHLFHPHLCRTAFVAYRHLVRFEGGTA